MAEHLYTYTNPTSVKDLARICRTLEQGGVIIYPTGVNWSVGCDAANHKALDRIRLLKPSHPKEQPFSLICSSFAMISEFAHVDQKDFRIMRRLLPGPYTLILHRNRALPKLIHDKRKRVGIRFPTSPLLVDLVAAYGSAIANTTLFPADASDPPEYGYQVDQVFGHGADLLLDLGDAQPNLQTTILDLTEDPLLVVREGIGPLHELSCEE